MHPAQKTPSCTQEVSGLHGVGVEWVKAWRHGYVRSFMRARATREKLSSRGCRGGCSSASWLRKVFHCDRAVEGGIHKSGTLFGRGCFPTLAGWLTQQLTDADYSPWRSHTTSPPARTARSAAGAAQSRCAAAGKHAPPKPAHRVRYGMVLSTSIYNT